LVKNSYRRVVYINMAPIATNVLSGPFNGYSAKQTVNSFKTSEDAGVRAILRRGWNTPQARGVLTGNLGQQYNRVITPFRAVNNSGDFLARNNYVCGGYAPGSSGIMGTVIGRRFGFTSNCDGTGIAAAACNPKFVADSSDYLRFRKQRAVNLNYNDVKNGGYTNSTQSVLGRVRN
jgi:hypothetical protein